MQMTSHVLYLEIKKRSKKEIISSWLGRLKYFVSILPAILSSFTAATLLLPVPPQSGPKPIF